MNPQNQNSPPAAGEAAQLPRKTLPWRVEPEYALVGAPMFISIAPFDYNGSGRTVAFAEKEEAAFIVRACNSNQSIVDALEDAMNPLRVWVGMIGRTHGVHSVQYANARNKLQRATVALKSAKS